MTTSITKHSAGCYTLSQGNLKVDITQFSKVDGANFNGWIAQAAWDKFTVSDPLPTLRAARMEAVCMIVERSEDDFKAASVSLYLEGR